MRAAGVPLFSVENHYDAGAFDVIAFNLSAELVYTNVLNLIDLAGVPVRAVDRTIDHPGVMAGGHCVFNPEPLADVIACFVPHGRRPGGRCIRLHQPRGHAAGAISGPRCLCAQLLRRGLRRHHRAAGRDHLEVRRYAGPDREAHDHRPRRVAVPAPAAGAAHRGSPRPAERRAVSGLHSGLPLLPSRHDHPSGPRASGRSGADNGQRWSGADRLRRGRSDVAVERGLLRHRGDRHRDHRRPVVLWPGLGQSAQPEGGCLYGGNGRPDPEGPAHRAHLRPRGRHLADAPGDQQADPRRRPLRRGGRRIQPGLETGQATRTRSASSPWPSSAWPSASGTTRRWR